jgi:hypothetical protein
VVFHSQRSTFLAAHSLRSLIQRTPAHETISTGDFTVTWIKTIPPEQADDELRQTYQAIRALYPTEYGDPVTSLVRPDGSSDSITSAHSLIPEAMRHLMSGLAVLLRPDLPLTRAQQEMIAAVVSVRNSCFY